MSVTTTILPGAGANVGSVGSDDAEAKEPGKSRKKLVIVAASLLVLLAVVGFVGKGLLAGPSAPEPDPKTVAGSVVTFSPITLNLADGRYLKLTLALQLSEAASPVAGSVDAAAAAVPALDGAKALDAAIGVLGQHTYSELIRPGGRAGAQKALAAEVKKRYPGDVLGVYFTEFLMQ
ncbi:MAG: flagellar basal body-associated FliL family protein [Dermatophilaceae bacterium]